MFKKQFFPILFLLCFFVNCSPVQQARKLITQGEVAQSNFFQAISYTNFQEWIIIEANLNNSDKKYRFLFDTGALTVISKPLAEALNLPKIVEQPVGSANSKKQNTVFTSLESIKIGEVDFRDIGAVVIDFNSSPEIQCLGLNIDGIIGSNLMKLAIWQVDFQSNTITLTDNRAQLHFQTKKYTLPFTHSVQASPRVALQLYGKTVEATFDTGKNGGIGLPFKHLEKALNDMATSDYIKGYGILGSGIFGAERDTLYKLSAKNVTMGDYTQDTLLIDSGAKSSALIGNLFMKNHKTTFDWQTKTITLEPYLNKTNPLTSFNTFGYGYTLRNDSLMLSFVFENSPIFKKAIPLGSKILKANGKDINALNINDFCDLKASGLIEEGQKTLELTVKMPNDVIKTVVLELEKML